MRTQQDWKKNHDDFAVVIQKNSSNIGHVHSIRMFPSLLVLPAEEWQRVVTGDEGKTGHVTICLHIEMKTSRQANYCAC